VRERGKVIEVSGSRARISLVPSEACKDCPSCGFCRPVGNTRIIETGNSVGAQIGDEVYIEISPRESLIAVFLFFGLPVLLGLIGLLIGIKYGEIHSVVLGIGAFAIGLILAKVINDILSHKQTFLPHIVEVTRPKGS
jgi:positive regulator of sigma E activity